MIKIFNSIFNVLKVLLLLASLGVTFYILIFMYQRLEKNPFGESFFEFFGVLLPFVILLFFYIINFVLKQKSVTGNSLYNSGCVMAFVSILYFGYRTLADYNMVLLKKDGYDINFNYFADQIPQIKIMIFLMIGINIFLIIEGRLNKKKEIVLVD